jgi:hypothetical protein
MAEIIVSPHTHTHTRAREHTNKQRLCIDDDGMCMGQFA